MKLMRLNLFRELQYHPSSLPDPRTLRKRIDRKDIPGKVEGGIYYVDIEAWERSTGHALADRVLLATR